MLEAALHSLSSNGERPTFHPPHGATVILSRKVCFEAVIKRFLDLTLFHLPDTWFYEAVGNAMVPPSKALRKIKDLEERTMVTAVLENRKNQYFTAFLGSVPPSLSTSPTAPTTPLFHFQTISYNQGDIPHYEPIPLPSSSSSSTPTFSRNTSRPMIASSVKLASEVLIDKPISDRTSYVFESLGWYRLVPHVERDSLVIIRIKFSEDVQDGLDWLNDVLGRTASSAAGAPSTSPGFFKRILEPTGKTSSGLLSVPTPFLGRT